MFCETLLPLFLIQTPGQRCTQLMMVRGLQLPVSCVLSPKEEGKGDG